MNSLVMINRGHMMKTVIHAAAVPSTIRPLRRPPPSQPLPDSNRTLKTLNFRSSCDRLHACMVVQHTKPAAEGAEYLQTKLLLYYERIT